jgi:hypothetical protein
MPDDAGNPTAEEIGESDIDRAAKARAAALQIQEALDQEAAATEPVAPAVEAETPPMGENP